MFLAVFLGVCIYNSLFDVQTIKWVNFWHYYIYIMFTLGATFLIVITVGGIRDTIRLFKQLKTQEVNVEDDGSVEGHHATGAR